MSAISVKEAPSRLLKIGEVKARTSLSPRTIYRWMKDKRFPEPIRYSETCVRWREADIDRWIDGKVSGDDGGA